MICDQRQNKTFYKNVFYNKNVAVLLHISPIHIIHPNINNVNYVVQYSLLKHNKLHYVVNVQAVRYSFIQL